VRAWRNHANGIDSFASAGPHPNPLPEGEGTVAHTSRTASESRDGARGVPKNPTHTAPICRHLLAGGDESLRLSPSAAAGVVLGGLVLLGIAGAAAILGGAASPSAWWPSMIAATLTAWLVAALAARWLGSRLGATAGLTLLSSVQVLLPDREATAEMLFCAAVSAAMGAFALANVPGRLPLIDHWGARWGFYAAAGGSFVLAGPVGPAFILTGCLLFLILSADSRGLRFFACPPGIAVFAMLAAVRSAVPRDLMDTWVASSGVPGGVSGTGISLPDLLRWLGTAGLPWTPLVVPAIAVGLHQGHYATPVWRFFGCWTLGPVACCLLPPALGGWHGHAQLSPLLPPLAVMAAAGLGGLSIRCRRRWPWLRGRRRATGHAVNGHACAVRSHSAALPLPGRAAADRPYPSSRRNSGGACLGGRRASPAAADPPARRPRPIASRRRTG